MRMVILLKLFLSIVEKVMTIYGIGKDHILHFPSMAQLITMLIQTLLIMETVHTH